jgi:hypothetical protein
MSHYDLLVIELDLNVRKSVHFRSSELIFPKLQPLDQIELKDAIVNDDGKARANPTGLRCGDQTWSGRSGLPGLRGAADAIGVECGESAGVELSFPKPFVVFYTRHVTSSTGGASKRVIRKTGKRRARIQASAHSRAKEPSRFGYPRSDEGVESAARGIGPP